MSHLVMLLLFAYQERLPGVIVDNCDVAEINSAHRDTGDHSFTQAVLWDYAPNRTFCVIDWVMVKKMPELSFSNRGTMFCIEVGGSPYLVRCKSLRLSWTMHDAEYVDRERVPVENRRRFLRPPPPIERSVLRND